jgi:hypothetical protein
MLIPTNLAAVPAQGSWASPPASAELGVGFSAPSDRTVGSIDIGRHFKQVDERVGHVRNEARAEVLNAECHIPR